MAFPFPQRATIWPGGFLAFLSAPTGAAPLIFDATLREDHGVSYAVTSSPLESGAQVTDHVQPQPLVISCEAVLAARPERIIDTRGNRRAVALYEQLLAIADTREPFDLAFTLRAYRSMVFERIGVQRTADSGDALVCSLTMRQVEIQVVDQAAVLADAAIAMSLGAQSLGSLTPPAAPAPGLSPGVTLPAVI